MNLAHQFVILLRSVGKMNKEKFLKELEKRLSILNEKEKQDIINEYKDTIEEKVKHGQKETEAVKDFGDMDELVGGILSAYKIDPKYNKEIDFKKFLNDGENLIKEAADKLASAAREMADNFKNNQDINLSLVFEILIKVFFTLLIVGLLRIPFAIFTHLGNYVFETLLTPVDSIAKILWTIFLGIIYLVLIALIVSSMFKQYFKKNGENSLNSNDKVNKIHEEDKNNSEQKKETKTSFQKTSQSLTSILMIVVKVWAVLFVVIPLVFATGSFIGAALISLYYWTYGIDLLGLTTLLLGISLIFIWLTKIVLNILQGKKSSAVYLLISGIALSIVGGFLFVSMLMSIDYSNDIPASYELETVENTYTTDKKVYIDDHNNDIKKIADETMADNTFKITAHYDQKLYNVKINQISNYTFTEEACEEDNLCGLYNYFSIHNEEKDGFKTAKTNYKNFIKDLKNKKVYNYNKLYEPKIEITANSKTLNIIEVD